jgi:hypothetical protein
MMAMTLLLAIAFTAVIGAATPAEDDSATGVRLARTTLARTLGVAEERVRVEDIRPVEWPDSALGCPEKGQAYTQGLVPGYAVRMNVDGSSHRVRVGGGRAVICDRESTAAAPKFFGIIAQTYDLARRDLAQRLKVEVKEVKVVRVRPTTWPDASMGCPEPKQTYEKAEIRGFLVELDHAGRAYIYHGDPKRVVLCPGH